MCYSSLVEEKKTTQKQEKDPQITWVKLKEWCNLPLMKNGVPSLCVLGLGHHQPAVSSLRTIPRLCQVFATWWNLADTARRPGTMCRKRGPLLLLCRHFLKVATAAQQDWEAWSPASFPAEQLSFGNAPWVPNSLLQQLCLCCCGFFFSSLLVPILYAEHLFKGIMVLSKVLYKVKRILQNMQEVYHSFLV